MNLLYLNTNLQFTLIYENDAHYKKLKTITGKKILQMKLLLITRMLLPLQGNRYY